MKNCGLLGCNISYSMSPQIHNTYYKNNNIPFFYKIFDRKEDELADFVKSLSENEIIGFNVTIPYKEKIIKFLDEITYPAEKINAVNTVAVRNNKLIGYNTDYYGFTKSLKVNEVNLEGANALILGNGGVSKCVLVALKDLKVSNVDIGIREADRREDELFNEANIVIKDEIKNLAKYDIIINCTPLGGSNYKDQVPIELIELKKGAVVYDLNYSPKKSKLLEKAEEMGAKIINGESMLEFQAIEAIKIWLE